MSSNPFRRSKLPSDLPLSTAVSVAVGAGDGAPSTPPGRTKKKQVHIQTPPHSPELTHSPENHGGRRLSASDSAARAESPPPPASAFEESESESDSTATADSELEEAIRNTRRNSGPLPPPTAPSGGGMKAPYNPFARTLATKQAESGLQRDNVDEEATQGRHGSGRPALDVDSFTHMLLTGSATPPPVEATAMTAPSTTASRPHDSSSSTDTSSIFDSGYALHQESPRTSFDDYEDASPSSGDEHADERSNLMGQGRSDDLAPPAPPKPKVRGPQTVSFADFDQSIPPDFQSTGRGTPPVNPHLTSILRPSMPRSSSDLNKPLPAPPKDSPHSSPPMVPDKDLALSPQLTPTGPTIDDQIPPKKVAPPPPPPTRRKGGESGRIHSMSGPSNVTQDFSQSAGILSIEESKAVANHNDISAKLAPAPPPPRKLKPTSHPSSEASSQGTSPSQSTNDVPKVVPAPPPRRTLSRAIRQESSARSSSLDIPRPNRPGDAFLAAVAPNNAPPAPPPRRGGSKRSSFDEPGDIVNRRVGSGEDYRRGSGNSLDSQRSTSISSLQQVPEPEEESIDHSVVSPPVEARRDILADLSAFQAEIDALRAQSESAR